MYSVEFITSRTILSPVAGFLRDAGFSHSLTPARNCTYGCAYCYVPTMRVQAGLRRGDWEAWGQQTAFKQNAADLLWRELRPDQVIYCSPLTDPYQPAESSAELMPGILEAVRRNPPRRFVIQTRSPLIVRDLDLLASIPSLRVSFSLTTDRDDVRRWFEPHCEPMAARLAAIAALRGRGIRVFATLAPLLPCDPDRLAAIALEATSEDLVGDPLHVRAAKARGATTREAAFRIAGARGFGQWLEPEFQQEAVARIETVTSAAGRRFVTGPPGFALLSS
jgi:DNA repair photolyase